jgi:putative endonuclease
MVTKIDEEWFVYLLECSNGKLYTGITNNLERRFSKHLAGTGARFTKVNRPSHMIAATPCLNRSDASKLERKIKGLTAAKKRREASMWPLRENLPKSNLSKHASGSAIAKT